MNQPKNKEEKGCCNKCLGSISGLQWWCNDKYCECHTNPNFIEKDNFVISTSVITGKDIQQSKDFYESHSPVLEEEKSKCCGAEILDLIGVVSGLYCRKCGELIKRKIDEEPTQEPMECESELYKLFGEYENDIQTKGKVRRFLQSQIKQAEERGYDKGFDAGGQTKGGTGRIMYQRGQEEYKQFILNILDGIDVADKQMGNKGGGTLAIRHALNSRII